MDSALWLAKGTGTAGRPASLPPRSGAHGSRGFFREAKQRLIGQGDAVILKVVTPPKLEEFQKLRNSRPKPARRPERPQSKGQI